MARVFYFLFIQFQGTILETSPGPISAADQDVGINAPLQYSSTGDYKHLIAVERDTGRIVVTEELLKQQAPVTVVIKVCCDFVVSK